MKKFYRNLVLKKSFNTIENIKKKLNLYIFINFNLKNQEKEEIPFLLSILFLLFSINLGQFAKKIKLRKNIRRYNLEKKFPLGIKFTLTKLNKIKNLIFLFSYLFYYNIFGDLKKFILDKKYKKFILFKFPVLNFFHLLNFNLITSFIFNLNLPNIKFLLTFKNCLKNEIKIIKNFFLLF